MNRTSRNYFILAIIIFISCNGYGQIDSIRANGVWMKADTLFGARVADGWLHVGWDTTFVLSGKNNYDTVKVIMLVCDTSYIELKKTKGLWIPLNYNLNIKEPLYCGYGYSVRKKELLFGVDYSPVPSFIHLYYLDENKNKLSNNIIVWQSIPIK